MKLPLLVQVERAARKAIRKLRGHKTSQPATNSNYWNERRDYHYYKEVVRLAKVYAGDAKTVLDVGCKDTPFVNELTWIKSKSALDLKEREIPGVKYIKANFFKYQPKQPYDLVLCLQVLEHIPDAEAFARKLLSIGKTVIISVPYQWPEGQCVWHCQDPVDGPKLLGWTGRDWIESNVIRDGKDRLVAVFRGDVGNEAVTRSAA